MKQNLVNGSSLLSEEAERGSFRLHPLIRQYVRRDAKPTARRLCQDIALRAVHEAVAQEQLEQRSTDVSSAQVTMRAVLRLAPHAVAVVRDQVDARELAQKVEHKFAEVTEPLADLTIRALTWSGRAVEAETMCTSLLDFLCWAQKVRGTRAFTRRLLRIFKPSRTDYFSGGKIFG